MNNNFTTYALASIAGDISILLDSNALNDTDRVIIAGMLDKVNTLQRANANK